VLELDFTDIILILVILSLLVGSTRLPKLAKNSSKASGDLQKGFEEVKPTKNPDVSETKI
jgi:Sec-independent protein translocase protein TatA